jgi:hypothetical protein
MTYLPLALEVGGIFGVGNEAIILLLGVLTASRCYSFSSLAKAGASGLFTLIQSGDRPDL